MKKLAKNISLFFVFSLILYAVYITAFAIFTPSFFTPNLKYRIGGPGHTYSRLLEAKKTRNVDVLFLGSSHTYRGFDTRMYEHVGIKSFNLGTSAQTPIQTEILLHRYLDSLHPKLVIYEVYPATFMLDGVESSLDLIANDRNDFGSFKMALKLNNVKTYNSLIYGIVRDALNLNTSHVESAKKGDDLYVSGGFVERKVQHFKPISNGKEEIDINANQLTAFTQVMHLLKEKNIKTILVNAPIAPIKYHEYANTQYFDSLMQTYADYYNFNNILHLNDSLHFYDSHHLNQIGVKIFNEQLIEIIKEKKLLPSQEASL